MPDDIVEAAAPLIDDIGEPWVYTIPTSTFVLKSTIHYQCDRGHKFELNIADNGIAIDGVRKCHICLNELLGNVTEVT